ncbi:MAG: 4Fe-4S binding protein, partial [Sphaerochaetaceae bacterium]
EKNTKTVPADTVLLSIGQSIEWGNMLEGSAVELRPGKAAVADSLTLQTAEDDIFVGGDVYTGPKFAIDAIAAGKEGSDSIHRFVHPGQTLTLGRNRREFLILDKDNVNYASYDNAKREKVAHDASKEKTFSDPRMTLTEEQVQKETHRCLECGAARVDPNQCIGCGECTVRCKFDAISLSRVFDAKSFGYENIKPHAVKRAIGRKINIALNPNRDSLYL